VKTFQRHPRNIQNQVGHESNQHLVHITNSGTSNPVILVNVLNQEKEKYNGEIDRLIAEFPNETEAQIADRVNALVVENACKILKPKHKETGGEREN
jgi:hypothetical protein